MQCNCSMIIRLKTASVLFMDIGHIIYQLYFAMVPMPLLFYGTRLFHLKHHRSASNFFPMLYFSARKRQELPSGYSCEAFARQSGVCDDLAIKIPPR